MLICTVSIMYKTGTVFIFLIFPEPSLSRGKGLLCLNTKLPGKIVLVFLTFFNESVVVPIFHNRWIMLRRPIFLTEIVLTIPNRQMVASQTVIQWNPGKICQIMLQKNCFNINDYSRTTFRQPQSCIFTVGVCMSQ